MHFGFFKLQVETYKDQGIASKVFSFKKLLFELYLYV